MPMKPFPASLATVALLLTVTPLHAQEPAMITVAVTLSANAGIYYGRVPAASFRRFVSGESHEPFLHLEAVSYFDEAEQHLKRMSETKSTKDISYGYTDAIYLPSTDIRRIVVVDPAFLATK